MPWMGFAAGVGCERGNCCTVGFIGFIRLGIGEPAAARGIVAGNRVMGTSVAVGRKTRWSVCDSGLAS